MGRACATRAPVLKDLHLYIIPVCWIPRVHVGLFCNALTGPGSYITPKAEKDKKEDKSYQFLVLLVMTFCWQRWWDGTLSEALQEIEEHKHVLKAYS